MAIGTKVGMTRIFDADGKAVAVSVIKVEPNQVISIKDFRNDSKRVQIAALKTRKLNKPETGHLKKTTEDKYRIIKEFTAENIKLKAGDKFGVKEFNEGDVVSATGISKGKGFSGVIKRHNFHRGPQTHGSDHHRKPGSIGSMFPQHVLKGQKMPGQMGSKKITVKNLKIVATDEKEELMLVSGAVPGNRKSVVYISK